ncbi:MAG: hypothetical protein J6U54_05220 [Clostridiales bacterium]|nr:hypothetical protein [Clostridiales bacterium]
MLGSVGSAIGRFATRTGLKIAKHSPEILLVVGIGCGVAAAVTACKATLKAEDILDKHEEEINKVKEAEEIGGEEYTEQDSVKDKVTVYTKTVVNFIKLYGPSIALGACSVACILSSYGIMRKRYLGVLAAYKSVSEAFKRYRTAVIEDQGLEADKMYFNGGRKAVIKDKETGETQETIAVSDNAIGYSQYAKYFDATSKAWEKDNPEYNLIFLKAQQEIANQMLHAKGCLFLNEVYDLLDIPRTTAGAVVGWIEGYGDDYVDFGIWNGDDEATRRFINGYEDSILLDFNVDGVILDLIDEQPWLFRNKR